MVTVNSDSEIPGPDIDVLQLFAVAYGEWDGRFNSGFFHRFKHPLMAPQKLEWWSRL
jgi:hypothetical protein